MHSLVIADTSCLIVLQKIDRLFILKELFKEITITQDIANEYADALPDWITIKSPSQASNFQILKLILDNGEASAIALGLENHDSLILKTKRKAEPKLMNLV